MKYINIEEWSENIGKYIGKYIVDLQYMQMCKLKNNHKEYLKYRKICSDEKQQIINTISTLEDYDFINLHK